MITDLIENAPIYQHLSAGLAGALAFLRRDDLASLPIGRHEINGEAVFAMISEYETKPAGGPWEAHRKYIDVQYLISGTERIGYAAIRHLDVTGPYFADKDYIALQGSGDWITLADGRFVILYPHDGHCPCVNVGPSSGMVRKMVVKVRVDAKSVMQSEGRS